MFRRAAETGTADPATEAVALKNPVEVLTNEIVSPAINVKMTTAELWVQISSGVIENDPDVEPGTKTPFLNSPNDHAGTGAGYGGVNNPSTPQLIR
jgi:hypothetical protein